MPQVESALLSYAWQDTDALTEVQSQAQHNTPIGHARGGYVLERTSGWVHYASFHASSQREPGFQSCCALEQMERRGTGAIGCISQPEVAHDLSTFTALPARAYLDASHGARRHA